MTESFHGGGDAGDTTRPIERRRCGLGAKLRFGFQSRAGALPGEMRKEYDMSNQVLHVGPAGVFLLPEAYENGAPARGVPEVSVPHLMGLRTSAARPHRRKVPLCRLAPALG
ncbi:hypothetical protein [Streptomyces spiralis]